MKLDPKKIKKYAITLDEFHNQFSPASKERIKKRKEYYDLLYAIHEARLENDLTQVQLAKKANISRDTLSRIEKGEANATVDTLRDIAYAMDMRLEINFVKKR